MDKKEKDSFLSETLFHFLGNGEEEKLMEIFDSIVRRGLLMTVGNKEGKLDRFSLGMANGVTESIEIMQHARVCFTDIPLKMLAAHCEEYGKFGIGFSRKTILAWGGNPVIYLPNHPTPGTLEESMGTILYCMHRVPLLMAALKACMAPTNASLRINETTLTGSQRDTYINQSEQSLWRMWGFVKEMSSQQVNDYRYLYEREWRIVDGATLPGVEIARELSSDEYREFASKRARWTKPLDVSEPIMRQYPHQHMLQLFRFFDGLPGKTISQAIDMVLVPSNELKRRIIKYMDTHPDRFSNPRPVIHVLGKRRMTRPALAR